MFRYAEAKKCCALHGTASCCNAFALCGTALHGLTLGDANNDGMHGNTIQCNAKTVHCNASADSGQCCEGYCSSSRCCC
jgi:hypothetical protein